MKRNVMVFSLIVVFLFSTCALVGASDPQYTSIKEIQSTEKNWQEVQLTIPQNTPIIIKMDSAFSGGWTLLAKEGQDRLVEYSNLEPWRAAEFTRNYTCENPEIIELISINGTPWQLFSAPEVYDDRPEFDNLKGVPGRMDLATEIKSMMTNPENTYSSTRTAMPAGIKKMISIYNNQTIAVLYTATTATPKALLAKPCTVNDRMLVPLRGVVDYLGADISWDAATSSIVIKSAAKEIKLQSGSKAAYINGTSVQMDTAPTILNGYTMVPLRFLSDQLGYTVRWISSVHRADISN